jgi:nucleoside-diphosphate-sugar epimerase
LSKGGLPRRFIYISTSGVYGDRGGTWVSETHPPNPQTARAQRRLDAEMQIRDWARRNGVSACILRVPGIYAEDRLPLERLRAGMAAIQDAEDSYTNHIHADDLAHIILAAMHRGRPNRVYHASDDSVMKMGDYFDVVADAYQLQRPRRISRAEAKRVMPESLLSFMNESRRLSNERMMKELQVRLHYPEVADFLATVRRA